MNLEKDEHENDEEEQREHSLVMETQAEDIMATIEYASSFDTISKRSKYRNIIQYAILAIIFTVITLITPRLIEDYPIISAIPALFILVYIFITKRIFESLTLGIILGFLMAYQGQFFYEMNNSLIDNLTSVDTAWLFVVCGLMGSFVALIERAGGVYAFGNWVAKRARTRKATLLWTWILGLFIFIDDYLNSLTVGSCMAPLTDKHKVSREYLAYIVDSTAAPDTVLIPVSTWAVFIAGLYNETITSTMKLSATDPFVQKYGDGLSVFIGTIPFNFYAWFCLIMVPLTIFGVIPLFGKMKKAEERARNTGVLAPPGSEKIDIRAGEVVLEHKNAKVMNFFVPIIVLIATTVYFDIDLQYGVLTTLGFMFVFYLVQGLVDADEFFDLVIKGFKNMLMPLIMVVLAYMFADGIEALGFMELIINTVERLVSPWMLPALIFLVFGITEFIMGLSWGMYAIAIPLVTVISYRLNMNPSIAISAVISAGVWGSHICFYSDATILSSSATGCDNFEHATSQLPFGIIAAVLSLIAFVITGIVLYGF
ncbi:MAG: Na+/H+ antiporter NhaC family protein [Tissierellaceae bacterium]|nr:Na+/H+ antiporter NhaC family protein [Tissierellaceae bacterium]